MKQLRFLIILALGASIFGFDSRAAVSVELVRVPHGGIQPRTAIDPSGVLHLIYFKGSPMAGDVFYVKREEGSEQWSEPIQVNHRVESAVAAGTIRGPQMALGKNSRIHVAWMGSAKVATPGKEGEHPKHPMLYARLNDDGTAFEQERDLLTWTAGLDGGGTVAADRNGRVYVAWHGKPESISTTEFARAVYLTRSDDDGKTFSREALANSETTGACGCCGMRGYADSKGQLYLLYRMANDVNRDMGLLMSSDHGRSFSLRRVSEWQIQACPMSSAAFGESHAGVMISTETEGRVEARLVTAKTDDFSNIPGISGVRREGKHPSIAGNEKGESVFAWSEGAGWKKGGKLKWQAFDLKGRLIAESGGADISIPEWSFTATATKRDGNFVLIY